MHLYTIPDTSYGTLEDPLFFVINVMLLYIGHSPNGGSYMQLSVYLKEGSSGTSDRVQLVVYFISRESFCSDEYEGLLILLKRKID